MTELWIQEARRPLNPVRPSRELTRIKALPRWLPGQLPKIDWTARLRAHDGTMVLRPKQCEALTHAYLTGGLFAPLSVGLGKTLIAYLLPSAINRTDPPRTVVLVPGNLVEPTEQLFQRYDNHFYIKRGFYIISYSKLSRDTGADILDQIQPGLIIADECHNLRNKDAARTKRFLRYMKAHPETMFAGLSGTITKDSIKDFGHLLELALGANSPLPRDWPTLQSWSEALDVNAVRPAGCLMELCMENETARQGVQRRMAETMGVVTSEQADVGATLVIEQVKSPRSDWVDTALKNLDQSWTRPDGEELVTAMDVARVSRQLRLGGYYRWKDRPSMGWLGARSDWHRSLRKFLQHRSRPGLDSPLLVTRAIALSNPLVADLEAAYRMWKAVEPLEPEPETIWEWCDERMLHKFALMVADYSPCIVWTDVVAFGEELAKAADLKWYGAGANNIGDENGKTSIVASIRAHGTGKNLQAFKRNVVLGSPPTGSVWEQLIGRTHRSGQNADEVEVYVLDTYASELEDAVADALYIESVTGNRQKLLYSMRKGW